jgi:hypothetical protein
MNKRTLLALLVGWAIHYGLTHDVYFGTPASGAWGGIASAGGDRFVFLSFLGEYSGQPLDGCNYALVWRPSRGVELQRCWEEMRGCYGIKRPTTCVRHYDVIRWGNN